MPGQLPLKFPLREEFTLDRFRAGLNRELIETATSNERVWIYGEARVGKTHLAQAVCGQNEGSVFLPAKTIPLDNVDLDGYGAYEQLVIDDADCWLGRRDVEEQLLALTETRLAAGLGLLMTASDTPHNLGFSIDDLGSRLRSFQCMELRSLPDSEKRRWLVDEARDRGLELTHDVLEYLFARVGRSQADLADVIEKLDFESLAQSRKLTIPFVREVLRL